MRKLKSLTALRAIAAITVVFFHTMAPTGHTFGEFGVDIFFLLSGFVIALVLDSPGMTAQRFVGDRIARIVPLYWLLTLGVFAGVLVAPSLFNSTTANAGNLLKSLFFIPYRKESGQLFPMLFVGWTLNYEMLFYAVTALALVLTRRHRLLFASLAILAIYCVAQAWESHGVLSAFYSNQRIFEFPLGFIAYRYWKLGIRITPQIAAVVAVAAYAWMAYLNWHGLAGAPLLYFGVPAFFVVTGCLSLEALMRGGPLTRIALYVGDASYAIYLSHPYCVEAARKLLPGVIHGFDAGSPVGAAAIIVVATAVGCALYALLDRPLHTGARRLLHALPSARSRERAEAVSRAVADTCAPVNPRTEPAHTAALYKDAS
ncbi:acyltransferase family protein [Paraburkholderia tropica]|uniref:acyltransferase family protein n=1 Tax=Paraburkholderia tropica TaxID=92647 RepID=UPI002AB6A380|nr:acyltransferase [Paraburkholderia tropica]